MKVDEIKAIFAEHWRPSLGSIAVDELEFVQDLIATHRPDHFLEVGMASGLSAGIIARFLEENGAVSLTSVDYDDTFFGDPSKPNGFLFDKIYTGAGLDTRLIKFKTSLDAGELQRRWQMAFIDANHQHPWPLIDTLAIWPYLDGSKIVIHHDLDLYMKQDVMFGIGPKYLHDQFPHDRRTVSPANDGNIFCLDLDIDRETLEDIAIRAFKLPWSLRGPLQPSYIEKIGAMLERHYSPRLRAHFDRCVRTQNVTDRFRSGL